MTAFVSVVVPTFNRPAAVAACLDALARQAYPADRLEVIVVDDGSAPTKAAAVAAAATRHGVRLVRQENHGPAAARNAGVRRARGEYVAFTDDDCAPASDWVAALAAAAAPDRALGGRTVNAVAGNACAEATQLLIDYLYEYYAGREGAFFTSNNLMMPRDRLLAIGGFDATIPHAGAEDREVCARWRDRGGALEYVPAAVVHHGHALTLPAFWRQHFTYGRGAWRYRLSRATWTNQPVRLEPWAFYRDLIAYPRRRRRGWSAAALLVVAQAANAAGYFTARLRSRASA